MRIAIIGAQSFLAKEIIRQAEDNFEILAIKSNSPISYYFPSRSFDRGFDLRCLLDYQVIISCFAAGVQQNKTIQQDFFYEVNAFEPIRLINGLETLGFKGKLFTFGSYFEIGQSIERKSYCESMFVRHSNPIFGNYAKSKRLLTQYVSMVASQLPFDLVHFILPNLYGYGENENRLFPYIKHNLLHHSKMEFTSGEQQRQFVHVSDIARQLLQMVTVRYQGVLNLSSESIKVKDVIVLALNTLSEKYGIKPDFKFSKLTKRDSDLKYLELDDQIARQKFSWKPETKIEMGIAEY
ncbi:MAG: NAD(P)-dependent oxidoreductase [Cyclobacteriaceae bacterium]